MGKKVVSSEKIIHVFANDIEFNYVAGENLSNNSENSKRKEKLINRFRSIEDLYNKQSGIKTKTRKRNRTINNKMKEILNS